MQIGEKRTWYAKNKDGEVIKTFNLTRTHRPYNYDLADAYNNARAAHVKDGGGVWVPTPGGGVALVQRREWTEAYTKELQERAEEDRERTKYMRENPFTQEEMFDV